MRNPVWRNFCYGKEDGQALLIVVLVIVVALTVGLSLASRSITNLRNTTDEANSQKAFAAAEAGVEQALKLGGQSINSPIQLDNTTQIKSVSVVSINGQGISNNQYLLNNGNPVFQDNGADVWLSPHDEIPLFKTPWNQDSSKTFTVYWGTNSDPCAEPAVEVLVISSTSTNAPQLHATLAKYAFDTCATRRSSNHFCSGAAGGSCVAFSSGGKTINGVDGTSQVFNYWVTLPITNGLMVRVIPLYTSGGFGVEASGLPPQGTYVTSTGSAGNSGQPTVRKVTFFQGYAGLPSELLYGLFSPK